MTASDLSSRIRNSTLVNKIPIPGALLGTTGSAAVLNHFSNHRGASFFGSAQDRYAQVFHEFSEYVWKPLQQGAAAVASLVNALINPDVFRPLTNVEELKSTPFCMQLPILYYAPVRELFEQGRIQGFGYNPTDIEGEDIWGRLIDNGQFGSHSPRNPDGTHTIREIYQSGDPRLSIEDLEAIDDTRQCIIDLLTTTNIDPTNVECERG